MPPRYTDEFKIDALENGYGVTETAERLGIHHDSLRNWIKRYQSPESLNKLNITDNANLEIKRLQKELKRVTEERDIFLCLHSL